MVHHEDMGKIMSTTIDLLTRKLEQAEDRLALAVSAAGIGVWDWDVQTGQLVWDKNMCLLFGVDPAVWNGTLEAFMDLIHPDHQSMVQHALETAVEKGTKYDVLYRIISRPSILIRSTGKCLYDSKGNPTRFIGVCVEDTPRLICANYPCHAPVITAVGFVPEKP